ncbi:diguanylate cyclase [Vibrio paucivorans]
MLSHFKIAIASFTLLSSFSVTAAESGNWESIYTNKLKNNDESGALQMLQSRYASLPPSAEKLYVSSKIHGFMTLRGQPFHGSASIRNSDYAEQEHTFISALNDEEQLNFVQARSSYEELWNEANLARDLEAKTLFEYHLCRLLNRQGQYHQAQYYCSALRGSLDDAKAPLFPKYRGYRIIGNNQEFLGEYASALDTYQQTLSLMPEYVDPSGLYNDIGLLLKELGRTNEAKTYLYQSLDIREQKSEPLKQAQVYHSLADVYLAEDDITKAIDYLEQSLAILKMQDHKYGLTYVNLGLGKALVQDGQFDKGLPYLLRALELTETQNNDNLRGDIYIVLALQYLQLQQLSPAKDYAEKAQQFAMQIGSERLRARSLSLMAEIAEQSKDFESALAFFRQYSESEIGIRNTENQKSFEALQIEKNNFQQQLAYEQLKNKTLEQENALYSARQYRLIYNLVIFSLLICLALLYFSQKRNKARARIDSLTNAFNRGAAIRHIKSQPSTRHFNRNNVLILLDLDKFKQVNDEHGHPTGDLALRRISKAIADQLEDRDALGRLGGEEFIVYLHNVEDIDVRSRVEQIHKSISDCVFETSTEQSLSITASMSFIATPRSLSDFDELYAILDQALYQAKANGRNCIVDAYKDPITLSMAVTS